MIKTYRNKTTQFFDLSGYGQEGKIEGIQKKEFVDMILELSYDLSDADMEFVLTAIGQELLKREK